MARSCIVALFAVLLVCILVATEGHATAQPCLPVARTWDYAPGGTSSSIGLFNDSRTVASIGNRAAFMSSQTNRLLVWDGLNAGGSPLLPDSFVGRPSALLGSFSGKFYFVVSDARLFACDLDGSNPTEIAITDANGTQPVTVNAANNRYVPIIEFAGRVVFAGSTPATGTELFVTNGTVAGTSVLSDIVPGPTGSNPSAFKPLRGRLFFFASTPEFGIEPWITDGTAAGTSILRDLTPSTQSTLGVDPALVVGEHGGYAYFRGYSQGSLFRTDGTPAGTGAVSLGIYAPTHWLTSTLYGLTFFGGTNVNGACCPFRWLILDQAGAREVATPLLTSNGAPRGLWIEPVGPSIVLCTTTGPMLLWISDGTDSGTSQLPAPSGPSGAWLRCSQARGWGIFGFNRTSPNGAVLAIHGATQTQCTPLDAVSQLSTGPNFQFVVAATPSRVFFTARDAPFGFEPRVIDLCPPDFNNSGSSPDAQDIFDFLTAFFTASPAADFNNSGGVPTVQDVFDFITAWFAGCS